MPGNTRFQPYKKPEQKKPVIGQMIVVELKNPLGLSLGPPLNISSDVTPSQLQLLVKELIKTTTQELEEDTANDFTFFVDNTEIIRTVQVNTIYIVSFLGGRHSSVELLARINCYHHLPAAILLQGQGCH